MRNKRKKNTLKRRILFLLLIVLACGTSILGYRMYRNFQIKEGSSSIEPDIQALFQNAQQTRFIHDISQKKIDAISVNVNTLEDGSYKKEVIKQIQTVQVLYDAYHSVKQLVHQNIIADDVTSKDIQKMKDKLSSAGQISKDFIQTLEADSLNILTQFHDIKEAVKKVNSLFQEDGSTLRETTTKIEIEAARNFTKVIRNKKAADTLQKKLTLANTVLKNMEVDQALQEEINTSYIVLNVPFINQISAGAPQGCEAASLLMALRYKGYASYVAYYAFMDAMPVSNNPNIGFVHSQYDKEPKDVPHTIYPSPLAQYGSTYGNVVDISGATPKQLREEIKNGNPIILYIVSGFKEAKWVSTSYGKDILNMHVVTLVGYNDKLEKYLINDPYYGNIWVSYEDVDTSYLTRSFAVVVQ